MIGREEAAPGPRGQARNGSALLLSGGLYIEHPVAVARLLQREEPGRLDAERPREAAI